MASTTVTFIRDNTAALAEPLVVNFTVAGTAIFGNDYTVIGAANFSTTAGAVIIPPNQNQTTITLISVSDTVVELDETVILTFIPQAKISAGSDSVVWSILNDDYLTFYLFFTSSNLQNSAITSINDFVVNTGNFNAQTVISSIQGMRFIN